MADNLHFELVSPERRLMSEAVEMVIVPGSEGDFGVLAGHAPLMSTLRPGILEVDQAGGARKRVFIRGGFAEVTPQGLNVLAEHATPVEDLNLTDIDEHIQWATEDLNDAKTDETRAKAEHELQQLQQVREIIAGL